MKYYCERNGSSLKAISYGYDGCYIFADCLIEGKFVNIIKFAWLTQENADYVRCQIQKTIKFATSTNQDRSFKRVKLNTL